MESSSAPATAPGPIAQPAAPATPTTTLPQPAWHGVPVAVGHARSDPCASRGGMPETRRSTRHPAVPLPHRVLAFANPTSAATTPSSPGCTARPRRRAGTPPTTRRSARSRNRGSCFLPRQAAWNEEKDLTAFAQMTCFCRPIQPRIQPFRLMRAYGLLYPASRWLRIARTKAVSISAM